MMIERLALVSVAALLLFIVAIVLKRQQLWRAKSASSFLGSTSTSHDTAEKIQLIYFWSTECSQCHTVQTPIIDRLATNMNSDRLVVTKFNAIESHKTAIHWGVRTVPTTYILDREGTVQHVNNGLTTEKILVEQIASLDT